ncbi:transcription factor VIP1-like [Dendrobium catenatum]|uniref:transcription factor VIP1-like n=1 Tax=Dendrobium catenatum TaxID=906689 RepID=UPI0009F663EC|nr:transcription factor VIP1-like [Dendrobium catenatum]
MDTNRPPDTLPANRSFGGGQIPPNPRSAGHRRSHSETFVRLPDDLLFDSDPDFNISDIDLPSLSDDNVSGGSATVAPAIPVEYGGRSDVREAHPGGRPAGVGAHSRSMSVDAAFFGAMGFQEVGAAFGVAPEKRAHHRHSSSMDGETSPFEEESTGLSDYAKKAMSADKLAELALIDPKRAKRILANRQSAARSKERKILYTSELERKVQTLQTEATTLSAQVTLLQRDTTGLTSANRELKLRLQAMEEQARLRDALNEALRGEVQRLKIATTQIPNGIENTFNRRFEQSISISPFYARPQQLPGQSGNLQAQQLHLTSPLLSSNGQSFSDHNLHDSMELM